VEPGPRLGELGRPAPRRELRSAIGARYACVVTRRSLAFLVVLACRREERLPSVPEPEPERQSAPTQVSPEVRARALIDTLEHGDAGPLAALITSATTWDGVTATGGKAGNSTTRAEIEMAGAAPRDLVGEFRRIAFVWTERDYVYVLAEHASGDFVYMVRFDDTGHLGHLTFAPPYDLPASSGCSPGAMQSFDDGSIFTGPTMETPSTIAIVGTLGGLPDRHLPRDLAIELSCKGIGSILVPPPRPYTPRVGIRFVIAHASDRALVPSGVAAIFLEDTLPKPKRDSGRSVIDSSHIAPSVVEQVAARVRSTP